MVCLLSGGIQATCSQASAQPKPPKAEKIRIQEKFTGYGLTPKEAEADALGRACDWLATHTDFGWTPPAEYLREKGMVTSDGEPDVKEFDLPKEIAKDGNLYVVSMQLTIKENQVPDIQKQAQHLRMKERQKHSLFGLLGAVALLSVVGGYLRLEEATKGYYTRLLRIAAVGVLVVIVAGLCVVG
jgi:hypothetical protein